VQPVAASGLAVGGEGFLLELEHLGIGEPVEPPLGERLQGWLLRDRGLDGQTHEAPGLAATARDRPDGVDRLLVRRARFVAVFGAEVARGPLDHF
jgi:hypothetical protein